MVAVPSDIQRCIKRVVRRPSSIRTKKQVKRVIYRLKRSADRKTRCGKRLIRLYNKYRSVL